MFKVPPSDCVVFQSRFVPFGFIFFPSFSPFFFLVFIFNFSSTLFFWPSFISSLSPDNFDPKTMFAVWVRTLGTGALKKENFSHRIWWILYIYPKKKNPQMEQPSAPFRNRSRFKQTIINLDAEASWVFLFSDRLVSTGVAVQVNYSLDLPPRFLARGRKKEIWKWTCFFFFFNLADQSWAFSFAECFVFF